MAKPSEAPPQEYSRLATSPLWWMLATLVGAVLTFTVPFLLFGLAYSTVDGSEGASEAGVGLGLIALMLIGFATFVCSVIWVYTIGQNGGTFGIGLLLLTMFPIYLFPLQFLGPIPYLLALLVYVCWPVRRLVTGIWTAGNLPRAYALIGWVPDALAVVLLLGAVITITGGSEYVTEQDVDGATPYLAAAWALALVSGAFGMVSLLTVTIVQHVGIGRDREVRRAAAASRRYV